MKSKKKIRKKPLICLLSILILMLLVLVTLIKLKSQEENIPALSLENFVTASIEVQDVNIFLTADCYRIVMTTTLEQTESISRILQNITSPRPNAHDLFVHTLKNFGIYLLFVKITSLKDGTYFATIFLRKGNDILALDARPSDAIAIASRTKSPVYLNKGLFQYAQKIC